MNASAYVRVSSKAQTHAMQRAALEQAAKARGDRITVWYSDKLTGGTMARPGLERLRADACDGKVLRAAALRRNGLTVRQIAVELGVPRATVGRALAA